MKKKTAILNQLFYNNYCFFTIWETKLKEK
jgi:hypothetical protein